MAESKLKGFGGKKDTNCTPNKQLHGHSDTKGKPQNSVYASTNPLEVGFQARLTFDGEVAWEVILAQAVPGRRNIQFLKPRSVVP